MPSIRLIRDAVLEDAPLQIHTPLAEIELTPGVSVPELADLLSQGDAGISEVSRGDAESAEKSEITNLKS